MNDKQREPLDDNYVILLEDEYNKMQRIISAIKSDFVLSFMEIWFIYSLYVQLEGMNGKLEVYDSKTLKMTFDTTVQTNRELFIDRDLIAKYHPNVKRYISEVV